MAGTATPPPAKSPGQAGRRADLRPAHPRGRGAHGPAQPLRLAEPGQAPGRLPHQGRPGHGHRPTPPAQLGDPEGDKRSITEIEAEEVGASLKWATAKVERTSQRGNDDRSSGRERQAERSDDFNDAPPF